MEGAALITDDVGRGRLAADDAFDEFHAFGLTHGAFVALDDAAWLQEVVEGLDDEVFAQIHREGERLEHEEVAVAVDDDAGEAVGLAPDEAAEVQIDVGGFAHLDGALDAAREEVEIEILAAVGEQTRGDLRHRVVDGAAEGLAAHVLEMDDVAGLGIAETFLNFSGVNPEVTVEEAGAGLDGEGGHKGKSRKLKFEKLKCRMNGGKVNHRVHRGSQRSECRGSVFLSVLCGEFRVDLPDGFE